MHPRVNYRVTFFSLCTTVYSTQSYTYHICNAVEEVGEGPCDGKRGENRACRPTGIAPSPSHQFGFTKLSSAEFGLNRTLDTNAITISVRLLGPYIRIVIGSDLPGLREIAAPRQGHLQTFQGHHFLPYRFCIRLRPKSSPRNNSLNLNRLVLWKKMARSKNRANFTVALFAWFKATLALIRRNGRDEFDFYVYASIFVIDQWQNIRCQFSSSSPNFHDRLTLKSNGK